MDDYLETTVMQFFIEPSAVITSIFLIIKNTISLSTGDNNTYGLTPKDYQKNNAIGK